MTVEVYGFPCLRVTQLAAGVWRCERSFRRDLNLLGEHSLPGRSLPSRFLIPSRWREGQRFLFVLDDTPAALDWTLEQLAGPMEHWCEQIIDNWLTRDEQPVRGRLKQLAVAGGAKVRSDAEASRLTGPDRLAVLRGAAREVMDRQGIATEAHAVRWLIADGTLPFQAASRVWRLRDEQLTLAADANGEQVWLGPDVQEPDGWPMDLCSPDLRCRVVIRRHGDGFCALIIRSPDGSRRQLSEPDHQHCELRSLASFSQARELIAEQLSGSWGQLLAPDFADGAYSDYTPMPLASHLFNLYGPLTPLTELGATVQRLREYASAVPGPQTSLSLGPLPAQLIEQVRALGGRVPNGADLDLVRERFAETVCRNVHAAAVLPDAGAFVGAPFGAPGEFVREPGLAEALRCRTGPAGFAHRGLEPLPVRLPARVEPAGTFWPLNPFAAGR